MALYAAIVIAPAADADALSAAATAAGDSRISSVRADEPTGLAGTVDAVTAVRLVVNSPTQDEAEKEARGIYHALREQAGLEPSTGGELIGTAPINPLMEFDDPKRTEFFQVAQQMFTEANYLYTVVAAQTAFELYMEGAFEYVLGLRLPEGVAEPITRLIRNRHYNMNDSRDQDLWESLTGHRVSVSQSWPAYEQHLKRRNDLVHRGERVSRDEATASLVAVTDLATEVAMMVRRLIPSVPGPVPAG